MQQTTAVTKPLLKSLGVDADASNRNYAFLQLFTVNVSEAQLDALAKASRFGWKITKIVYRRDGTKGCALAMYSNDCTAWMTPDGKIERAANGRKTAYLTNDWIEHV